MSLLFSTEALVSDIIYISKVIGYNLTTKVDQSIKTFKLIDGDVNFEDKTKSLEYMIEKNKNPAFYFSNQNDKDTINKWLSDKNFNIDYLNSHLLSLPYVATITGPSIADLYVYYNVHSNARKLPESDHMNYCNFYRWIDHIQNLPSVKGIDKPLELIIIKKEMKIVRNESINKFVAPPPPPPTTPIGRSDSSTPHSETDSKPNNNDVKKTEKKIEKKTEKKTEKKDDKPTYDISALDIRVGLIKDCWNHLESEKLLCEEIEVGNGEIRQIGSGIRQYYKAEDLKNKKVIVLCNLKPRSLAGFKSHGMVLCASTNNHNEVEILEPNDNSNIGDKITFDGYNGLPVSDNILQKKKILELILPDFKTNEDKLMTYKGIIGKTTSGVISCKSLVNADIS